MKCALYLMFLIVCSTGFASSSTDKRNASISARKMSPDLEAKCRQTQAFRDLCRICQADKVGNKPTCSADVPNHGSSPEFMQLVHSLGAMIESCGYKVPDDSCVRGLIGRMAAICRNEEKIPDIKLLIEPGNCN